MADFSKEFDHIATDCLRAPPAPEGEATRKYEIIVGQQEKVHPLGDVLSLPKWLGQDFFKMWKQNLIMD